MNHPLFMDVNAQLTDAQRLRLYAELETLLEELRYDGLLPGTGLARLESDLQAEALSRGLVLARLHDMAEGLDCRAERAAYESLPEWPRLTYEAAQEHGDAPDGAEVASAEALIPEATALPDTTVAEEEATEAAATEALPVAVLPESLADVDALDTGPAETPAQVRAPVEDTPAEAEPAPLPDNLDPFELAQTVTAQLMNRLDEQLASQFPPAVYDSFAELYFQFSARVCERLGAEDPHQLIRLMGQEAAR